MTGSRASPWAWVPLGILLSLSVGWFATRFLVLRLELPFFLPLLAGWLASRYGRRAFPPLFFLGLLSALRLSLPVTDRISLDLGFPLWIFILSICTGVAFSQPRLGLTASEILHPRRKWLKWLAPLVLWFFVFTDWHPTWEMADELWVGTNVPLVLLVSFVAASAKLSGIATGFRSIFPTESSKSGRRLLTGLVVLLALALVLLVRYRFEFYLRVSFGFDGGYALVFALAFLLSAWRVVDWRLTVVFLLLFFASEPAVVWAGEALESFFGGGPEMAAGGGSALRQITVTSAEPRFDIPGVVHAICAAFLGAALAPFWRQRVPEALRTRRTSLFLLMIPVVLFLALPATDGLGRVGLALLGGVAFATGLIWRVRGIIAGPVIIQILFVLFLVALRPGVSALELGSIGLFTFPFERGAAFKHTPFEGEIHVFQHKCIARRPQFGPPAGLTGSTLGVQAGG